ncbi:MAG: glucose-1-phosphate thymidylyltransferase [Nanoarchaeota archaeon]|nr:MAG: glucose-1-phosphate thymidylyltransferase [Nanoarchaeota archaeon]
MKKAPIRQAVLLCAGKSTRTYPLTVDRPKPLLSVANVPILEHNLRQLEGIVDEALIIAGYEVSQIRDFLSNFKGIKAKVIVQEKQLGTAHAVLQTQPFVRGRFLVLNGDVMYDKKDLVSISKRPLAVLGVQVSEHGKFGMIISKAGYVTSIMEKPAQKVSDLANTGAYVFDERVFDIIKKLKKSPSGEYYLTDAIEELAKTSRIELETVKGFWIHIAYPWDLLSANEFMLAKMKSEVSKNAVIEKGTTIKGNVSIGAGTLVRSGAYIEGPAIIGKNCTIGPNCYVRPGTSIADNAKVGNGCEVKNSILYEASALSHLCYVGDSIIGRRVNLGGGTIIANLRHDKQEVSSMVNGALISTGLEKFGAVIGDNAKTGINTSIYPGRKIWPFRTTIPGEVVNKDIM